MFLKMMMRKAEGGVVRNSETLTGDLTGDRVIPIAEVKEAVRTAKADRGKLKITLVPTQIVRDIAEVRMYGNKKYGSPDNWKEVEVERYRDALCRHLLAYIDDPESIDEESGIPHYKHIACNMAFICEMERWKKEGEIVVYPQNG